MTVMQMIGLAVQASMAMIIFSVGLQSNAGDLTSLMRRPGLLLRSLLAMNVIMPILAVALARWLDLNPALEVVLVTLALAPVPPILPNKELEAGGSTSSIVGVLVAVSLLSIVVVPLGAHLAGQVFDRPVTVPPAAVAKIVFTSLLLPLGAGVLLRALAPTVAAKLARPLSIIGSLLLVVAVIPVLIAEWHAILALIGNFTIVVVVGFVLVGLAVGHALGGPDPDDRTVLALSTATRHPAIALAIAHDAHDKPAVIAAMLLMLLVGGLVSVPYVKWRRRAHATGHPPPAQMAPPKG